MRYTKKAPDNSVEAVQWDGTAAGAEMVINNVGAGRFVIDNSTRRKYIVLDSKGTEVLRMEKGDWLVMHQEGPPIVMDDKTFRETYESGPPVFIPTNWTPVPPRLPSRFSWWDDGKFTITI